MEKLSNEKLVSFYRDMLKIRRTEEKLMEVFYAGEIQGFLHVSNGQEAAPVGIAACLNDDDYIGTTHRGHGYAIAKGLDLNRALAELFGRKAGYCMGRSGSMHLAALEKGVMGANGIVGGGIPIVCGAGFAAKYKGTTQVAVATFGDGATNEGAFHEAMNLAAVMNLPVIFLCENNGWAEFTPRHIHCKLENLADRAAAYGMPSAIVDNDVEAIYEVCSEAVARARAGEGPTFIEVKNNRWHGHFVGDGQKYRSKEDIDQAMSKDCIKDLEDKLLKEKILKKADIGKIEESIKNELEAAVNYARECPYPEPSELMEGLYV
jgi:TPP-dependent pyruvate/acetoin dehydrogenase alpha subunit